MVAEHLESLKRGLDKPKIAQKEDADGGRGKRRYYTIKRKLEDNTEDKVIEPRIKLSENKAVYVTASHYNEELGLLAIVLIDREVKIYYIKQNGSSMGLEEHLSFKTKFDISCIHLDRYVMDGKPILVCGTQLGMI